MNLGIIAALVAVLFTGVAQTSMKSLATSYKRNYTALFFQYISVAFFALLYVLGVSRYLGTDAFPSLDSFQLGVLAVVGVIGFIGIVLLYKAYEKLCSGVALTVANTSVFLMYFANLYLFDASENLPLVQVVLAILFFVVVAQFLWTKSVCPTDDEASSLINRNVLYPVGTAICWTVFFVGNTWFVKNEIMTPVQSVFATEGAILVVIAIYYALRFKFDFSDLQQSFKKKDLIPITLVGIGLVGGNSLFYYGYLDNPANIINFIRLFSIITTSVFSWIFLKDYMTKKQMILMTIALIVLILFVFAEDIMMAIGL